MTNLARVLYCSLGTIALFVATVEADESFHVSSVADLEAEWNAAAPAIPACGDSCDSTCTSCDGAIGSVAPCSGCCCCCCPEPWIIAREPWCCHSHLDCLTELGSSIDNGCNFKMPITGGAWHWFHQSLIGRPGGYGIPGLRDTYF